MTGDVIPVLAACDNPTMPPAGRLVLVSGVVRWDADSVEYDRGKITAKNTKVRLSGVQLPRGGGYQLVFELRGGVFCIEKSCHLLDPMLLVGLPENSAHHGEQVPFEDMMQMLHALSAHGVPVLPHEVIELEGAGDWEHMKRIGEDEFAAPRIGAGALATAKTLPVALIVIAVLLGVQWSMVLGMESTLDDFGDFLACVLLLFCTRRYPVVPVLVVGPFTGIESKGVASGFPLVCTVACSVAHAVVWGFGISATFGQRFLGHRTESFVKISWVREACPWIASAVVICTGLAMAYNTIWGETYRQA